MTKSSPSSGQQLPPLAISCTRTECDNDLHCFRKTSSMTPAQIGSCRACGVQLIDWDRMQKRDIADSEFMFASLRREWVRHHFWHAEIDEVASLHARRLGRTRLREQVAKRLRTSVGKEEPFRDGYQTPYKERLVYYAQHALACCCRTCLAYWHGIPKGIELPSDQISYLTDLVMRFVDERMPALTETGEYIPPRRSARAPSDATAA